MAAPAAQPLPVAAPQPLHVSNAGGEPETPEQLRERERLAALASGFTPGACRGGVAGAALRGWGACSHAARLTRAPCLARAELVRQRALHDAFDALVF